MSNGYYRLQERECCRISGDYYYGPWKTIQSADSPEPLFEFLDLICDDECESVDYRVVDAEGYIVG